MNGVLCLLTPTHRHEEIDASTIESPSGLDRRRALSRRLACRLSRPAIGVFFLIFGCLLAATLSGCGASLVTTSSGAGTTFPLSAPSSVDFGTVAVGQTGSSNVTLVNQTSSAITVSQLSITGNTFLIAGQNNVPITITPNGGSYTVTLQFAPQAEGAATGQLTITTGSPLTGAVAVVSATSSNSSSLKIKLNGNGHGKSVSGSASLSSLTCSLASITGAGTDACTVTLSAAAGSGGLTVSLSSNNSAVSVPASVTVPAGATSVGFSAKVTADTTAQAVTLTATAGGVSQTFTINLGAYVPALTLSSTSLNFGDVTVNTTATQSVTLTSSGTAPLTISADTLTGANFSISGISSPLTLNPGQTATVAVSLNPTTTGTATGTLTLTDNASPSTTAISLNGTGQTAQPVAITISPTQATLGVSSTQQFTAMVSNTTNQNVTWSVNSVQNGNATYGTITSSGLYTAPASVPSGGTVTVTADSTADTSKSASASVTIAAAPQPVAIAISPTSVSVQGNLTQQFTAQVSGTTNTAVNWLVQGTPGGNSTYGTISPSGLYTAPACPSVSSVTVTAQSVYDSTITASATASLSAASPNSADRYVATNGSDSNDGSACTPWATIGHATSLMNPGETIIVEDGTYYENLVLTRSGTASAPIVIKAQNRWGAKIVPVNISGNLHYFSGANYVTLQDFEFTSSGSYVAVIKIDSGQYDSIIGNKIHDTDATPTCSSGHGILVADSYNTIQGNTIFNIGPPRSAPRCNQNHGIYITAGSYGTVADNLIMEVWQGLAIHMAGIDLSHWTIANNTVVNSGTNVTGSGSSSGGPEVLYCEGGTCDYNTYSNNIFADTQGGYCFIEQNAGGTVGSHNQYLNNLLYSCGSNIFVTGTLQNTVTSDPQFVNYTGDDTGNYQLQPSSPAINTGTSVGCPSYDADYQPRPTGSACDIGAFEYIP